MDALTIYHEPGQELQIVETMPAHEPDAAFLDTWLFGKSEKTRIAYTRDILRFYAFVDRPLAQVTLSDVQAFITSLSSLKASSRARTIAALKSCFSFALNTGYLKVNVGAAIKLPKIEDTLAERIMSQEQVARVLALETNKRNHAILALLYRAGLRCAELCDLTWRNMHERDRAGQISVYGKGGKTRQVLLNADTWAEVMHLKASDASLDDYVFQSRQSHSRTNKADRRLDESTVFRLVQASALKAGIANVSPHWMRHAHATHSQQNGASINLVKETLGHASIVTTSRYSHILPDTSSGQFLKV